MAEVKRTFHTPGINRDLDDRLLPNGMYRDGLNINVGRSEGNDVGAVENLRGNIMIDPTAQNFVFGTTIGTIVDPANDRLYWFNTDASQDAIYEYDGTNVVPVLVDERTAEVPLPTCTPDFTAEVTGPDGGSPAAPPLPVINPTVTVANSAAPAVERGQTGSTTLTATVVQGSGGNITYLWSSGENTQTITVTSTSATSVNRTVTVTADDGGTAMATGTATFTFNEPPPPADNTVAPTIMITGPTSAMVGDTVTLGVTETLGTNMDGSAATLTSRTWSDSTTGTTFTVDTTAEGTQSITVTLVTSSGMVTDSHDITISAQPVLSSSVTLTVVNNVVVPSGVTINATGNGAIMTGRYSPTPAEAWTFESVLANAPDGFEYTDGPTAAGTGVNQNGNTATVSGVYAATNTNPTITWTGTVEAVTPPMTSFSGQLLGVPELFSTTGATSAPTSATGFTRAVAFAAQDAGYTGPTSTNSFRADATDPQSYVNMIVGYRFSANGVGMGARRFWVFTINDGLGSGSVEAEQLTTGTQNSTWVVRSITPFP